MTAQDYKKRKAIRIVELEPIQVQAPAKENSRIGPLGILEPFQYETESYRWTSIKSGKLRTCIYCGKLASHIAYFQIKTVVFIHNNFVN